MPPAAADAELGPPPSQKNEQVSVSFVPWSATFATTDTVLPMTKTDPDGGLPSEIVGATLLSVSVPVSATGIFTPSLAVSVSVNVPSSVQVTVVSSAAGLAITQDVPRSTPAFGVTVQVCVTGSPSGSTTVP